MKKLFVIIGLAALTLVTGFALVGFFVAPKVKSQAEGILSIRTGRPVRIQSLDWTFWPTLQFQGSGLQIGSEDTANAVFARVESLTIRTGLIGLLKSPRSISSITLSKVLIRIPPRRGPNQVEIRPVSVNEDDQPSGTTAPVKVRELRLEAAIIELISKDPVKPPRVIKVEQLRMKDLTFGLPSPFEATIKYPHPEGDVEVEGEFGPFNRDEPIRTPVSGRYIFKDADLSSFLEISGSLTSTGAFRGDLGENHIEGEAEIPDFQLTKAENIVPLNVTFIVDRKGSDVFLRDIESSFLETRLTTRGEITRDAENGGRIVRLQVNGSQARVEDLLLLSLKGEEPPLRGQIQLDTRVVIPPGPGRVLERIEIDGEFRIKEGEFTDPEFQKKLAQISKFGRADQSTNSEDKTFSDLAGVFRLEDSEINFSKLHFGVPGMLVSLVGSYGLESNEVDFRGKVNLERSVSEMTSGRLSDWLRILDPVLAGEAGGTSVPIRIKGNRSSPSVSVDF